jgi:hypothetical protein
MEGGLLPMRNRLNVAVQDAGVVVGMRFLRV